MKQENTLETIMAKCTGLSGDIEETKEYVKNLISKGRYKTGTIGDMLCVIDESHGKIISYLEENIRELHYGYFASTKIEAVIFEYIKNIYDKESGAIIMEDKDGDSFNICAEIDYYNDLERIDLPANALLRIYALAIDVTIFKDKTEFDSVVNKNPISNFDGIPISFGTTFISPSGIMPGNEETMFPSMAHIIAEVITLEVKTNSFTKRDFCVMKCTAVFGEFELLCSTELINENIKAGSVIDGHVMFRAEILKTWKVENEN